jgi:3',5'-cyclic AMP phosphodiesterase CpdA
MGDHTGEAVPGVWEQAWREAAAEKPAFVLTIGDTIQGLADNETDTEWKQALHFLAPFEKQFPVYLTPGNHDIWSAESAAAYQRYTKRPLHYSFDWHQAHFTILDDHDNNAMAPLAASELEFLESDLEQHAAQPLKFIVSHRPFWIVNAALLSSDSPAQRLASRDGVQFFIAGHIHQMLHFTVGKISYVSLPSAGGHLRATKQYKDGWFFGHTLVHVHGSSVEMDIEETAAPFGKGRITHLNDWTGAGLAGSAK